MNVRITTGELRGGQERACAVPSPQERFRELYAAEVVNLVGYAARRLEYPDDAPDVIAEVFSVAWRRIGEVPPGAEARLWLYGVARKTLANHRRVARRHDRLTARLRGELRIMATPVNAGDAEVLDVRAALARLADDDRELLLLTSWEGLTPSEIASVMDLPAGTVRRRLHHARQHLRDELGVSGPRQSRQSVTERSAATGHEHGSDREAARDDQEPR